MKDVSVLLEDSINLPEAHLKAMEKQIDARVREQPMMQRV